MGSADSVDDPVASTADGFRAAVPGRAVLTELARGFLLVHESNPNRAVRFAETFLRECTNEAEPTSSEPVPRVTAARLRLGRLPRGAVDPGNFPPVR
jgi:hypothetical protein